MARLAHGLADDVLTEAVLAHDGPMLVAPAMNTRMWEHPATRANHELLLARGVEVVGPASGELAEGESASAAWPSRPRSSIAPRRCSGNPARSRRPRGRHGRRHTRADRLRPLHRQSLVRPDGVRPRRRGTAAWRPCDAARSERQRRSRRTVSRWSRPRRPPISSVRRWPHRRGRDRDGRQPSPTTAQPRRSTGSGRRTGRLAPRADADDGYRPGARPSRRPAGARGVRGRAR